MCIRDRLPTAHPHATHGEAARRAAPERSYARRRGAGACCIGARSRSQKTGPGAAAVRIRRQSCWRIRRGLRDDARCGAEIIKNATSRINCAWRREEASAARPARCSLGFCPRRASRRADALLTSLPRRASRRGPTEAPRPRTSSRGVAAAGTMDETWRKHNISSHAGSSSWAATT